MDKLDEFLQEVRSDMRKHKKPKLEPRQGDVMMTPQMDMEDMNRMPIVPMPRQSSDRVPFELSDIQKGYRPKLSNTY